MQSFPRNDFPSQLPRSRQQTQEIHPPPPLLLPARYLFNKFSHLRTLLRAYFREVCHVPKPSPFPQRFSWLLLFSLCLPLSVFSTLQASFSWTSRYRTCSTPPRANSQSLLGMVNLPKNQFHYHTFTAGTQTLINLQCAVLFQLVPENA